MSAALGALSFFITMGACTEVDDRLGAGLVPRNQRMEIEVTSPSNAVETFLYREDSIPSSRTGRAWFGRTIDAEGIFGAQTSSALLQFIPVSVPYSGVEGFGIDPIVDSAVLIMTLDGIRGDSTVVQRFDVWDVAPRTMPSLHRDSTYYTNFPIDEYRGEKLFEFTHTGRRDVQTRLFPTAAGKKYLDSIVRLHEWDDYITDSLFLKKFQGLYIAPAPDSPAAAALYGTDLTASGIQLHVRNHDTLDVSAIYDTVTTLFMFQDTDVAATTTSAAQKWNNVSINMSSFDYTGSVLGTLEVQTNGFTDTLPSSIPLSTLYVQSMNGVGAYLRFNDELVEEIRNLRFKTDELTEEKVGKDIAINQAVMRIWIENDTVEGLDASMARIGSYLDPKSLHPIPDYQYATEKYNNAVLAAQKSSETYSLPYGGYLNRSNGYYELDITSYIQQLARVKEDDPKYRYVSPVIFLGPEAYQVIGTGQSILKGLGSSQPVSIRITYTIIEG